MSAWQAYWMVGAAMVAVMALLWVLQWRTRDAGLVDVGWAAGVGASAVYFAAVGDGDGLRRLLLALLGGIWGLRLAYYLLVDRVLQGPEDGRYQNLRAALGRWAQPGFLLFFQVQAGFVLIFALPFLVVAYNPRPGIGWLELLAILIWLTAVIGESIADRQLAAFRRDPANRGYTCRQGLWRYSRHPNYFFEWVHWWAYLPLAIGSEYWWICLLMPFVVLLFLLKLTGIPYTEARARETRADYRDYQESTSIFFPWPPKTST